jgi:hypothetical protein
VVVEVGLTMVAVVAVAVAMVDQDIQDMHIPATKHLMMEPMDPSSL